MQMMVVGTVIVVASSWGVIKFIKPFVDQLVPKPQALPQNTNTVVLPAAFVDSKAMSDLQHSIDRLCESQDRANETCEKSNIINQMLLEAINRLIHKP